MITKFKLDRGDIEKVVLFSEAIHENKAQSPSDFGDYSISRKIADSHADNIEGKLSELVFAEFMKKNSNISIGLDFGIYSDKLLIDYGQDIDVVFYKSNKFRCRSRVDVKATRNYSKWMLVESHKFWADAYVLIKMDLPNDFEKNTSCLDRGYVNGEVAGFAYHFDIIDPASKEPWFIFSKGDCLFSPHILSKYPFGKDVSPALYKRYLDFQKQNGKLRNLGGPLKAERNYGLPIKWLRNNDEEWQRFFRWISGSSIPIDDEIVKKNKP